jgi:hypothetical protein
MPGRPPRLTVQPIRVRARCELLQESNKHDAVKRLRQIPSIAQIRAALLVALPQTPSRFVQRKARVGPRTILHRQGRTESHVLIRRIQSQTGGHESFPSTKAQKKWRTGVRHLDHGLDQELTERAEGLD